MPARFLFLLQNSAQGGGGWVQNSATVQSKHIYCHHRYRKSSVKTISFIYSFSFGLRWGFINQAAQILLQRHFKQHGDFKVFYACRVL